MSLSSAVVSNIAPELILQAATILVTRRQSGVQGERLPPSFHQMNSAAGLAIQAAVSAQMGDHTGAWKCGIAADDRVVRVILAPIYSKTIYSDPIAACPVWSRAGHVKIEPELAFILGCDLPARDTPYEAAEVDAAIIRTHIALELIDSRYTNPDEVSFVENLADGLLNQGLFLGPEVDSAKAKITTDMAIKVSSRLQQDKNLMPLVQFEGRHPNTHPRAPLYWLAEYLRSQGQGLQAGQAIITGSYAGSFEVALDQDIFIQFGDLGELNVNFSRHEIL
ncbi:2-keto-4-pentenoate hydratase [Undibacterium sp. GrIS 1.8]|uniref:hypothetical protein n=1 Tax=unclassified Undibacterium TaxID=2630295 RepID=UPI003390AE2F